MNFLSGERVEFVIPGEARGKQRPRATKKGRVYTPSETRNAEAFIKLLATHAMNGRAPFEGPVRLYVEIDVPVPKSFSKKKRDAALGYAITPTSKPDLDNVIKLQSDAMNGVVYQDDKQIIQIVAAKRYSEIAQTRVIVEGKPTLPPEG